MSSQSRGHIPDDLRSSLWERSQGNCESCGTELHRRIPHPVKKVLTVEVWDKFPCYRCGHLNQVILLTDQREYGILWLDKDEIGKALSGKYPFFRKGDSKTVGDSYYANHCNRCGALQGDWFVMEWLAEQAYEATPISTEEFPYEGELGDEDEEMYDEFHTPYDIHHRDGNPLRNSMDNLQLVCIKCHRKLQRQLRELLGKKGNTSVPGKTPKPQGAGAVPLPGS